MKFKKLIGGLLLSTVLAAGIGVSLGSNKQPVEKIKATEVTSGSYRFNVLANTDSMWTNDNIWTAVQLNNDGCVFTGADSDLGSAVANKSNWRQISLNDETFYMQTIELPSDYSTTLWEPFFQRCNSSTGGGWWNKIYAPNSKTWADKTENTVVINNNPQAYRYGLYFKVALHGGANADSPSYSLVNASNYNPGTPEVIDGYVFEGWYTDDTFETKYTIQDLTGDLNLYAHYLPIKQSYVYMQAYSGWSAYGAYTWETINGIEYKLSGNYGTIKTPGTVISNVKVSDLSVVKVPFYYCVLANAKMCLYQGDDGNKSKDITNISEHAYYDFTGSQGEMSVVSGKGEALELITLILSKVGNATVDGKAVTNSICAISGTDRSTITSRYSSLVNPAKGFFDAATYYTYTPGSTSAKSDVTFARIMAQLQTNNANSSSISILLFGQDGNSTGTTIIIIIISAITLAAVGGYFLFKKKKD